MSQPKTLDLDDRLEKLYDLVAEDEDTRTCGDLDDQACHWVPRNFFVFLLANALTKLGDALSSPKTVLTWVMVATGAPAALVAWLVPLRESGSMIPQLLLGAVVRRRPLRRPIWLLGSVLQALAVLGCAAAAVWLRDLAAGVVILVCVTLFALARSLNSLASKDLVGKTIPRGRRGRLGGYAASISGVLTLLVGVWFYVRGRGDDSPVFYAGLLAVAGCLWLLATLVFVTLREQPGEVSGGRQGWGEAWSRLGILVSDAPFRRFVITRSLLLCSALTAPYYVVLARQHGDAGASMLGIFLVAGGLSASLSAPFWGIMADRSSRKVMIAAAVITGGLGLAMVAVVRWWTQLTAAEWLFPAAFFLLGVAHAGVRAGRKTYLVDLAGGVKRTDYVAVSNTLIGIMLLVVGAGTSALSFLGPVFLVGMLSLLGLVGAAVAVTLPEAGE